MKKIKKYIVSCHIEAHCLTADDAIETAKMVVTQRETQWTAKLLVESNKPPGKD